MKKIIVISAINIRQGGMLSVFRDALNIIDRRQFKNFKIFALVHKKELFIDYKQIDFMEFPDSASSYLKRIYYEYFMFKKLSKKLKPDIWFSFHDTTPNVHAKKRVVYCHNTIAFYKFALKEIFLDPKLFLYGKIYKYIYKINIKKNYIIIVQQNWLREEFIRKYGVKNIAVAYPSHKSKIASNIPKKKNILKKFFYPAIPLCYKNFQVICKATNLLNEEGFRERFKIILTLSKGYNKYSDYVYDNYNQIKNIEFIGLIDQKQVFNYYRDSDCLIFPSNLESWGMPITEFKYTRKPMLIADLPYAHETVGNYKKVNFFDPNDFVKLAQLMKDIICDKKFFSGNIIQHPSMPFLKNWNELFEFLLLNKEKEKMPL